MLLNCDKGCSWNCYACPCFRWSPWPPVVPLFRRPPLTRGCTKRPLTPPCTFICPETYRLCQISSLTLSVISYTSFTVHWGLYFNLLIWMFRHGRSTAGGGWHGVELLKSFKSKCSTFSKVLFFAEWNFWSSRLWTAIVKRASISTKFLPYGEWVTICTRTCHVYSALCH